MVLNRYFTGRRSLRIRARVPANLVVEGEGLKITHKTFTVDVSQHGLRVEAKVALAPGQLVEIAPSKAPTYGARCRVVWIGMPGSTQEGQAGLEFLSVGNAGGQGAAWRVFLSAY